MRTILRALVATLVLAAITGLAYPLVMTGIGQLAFAHDANGSLVDVGGQPVGSALIGQAWTSDAISVLFFACYLTAGAHTYQAPLRLAAWISLCGFVSLTAFLALNQMNVEQDLARGHGEYATSLGTLLGLPNNQQTTFHAKAQGAFETLLRSDPEARREQLRMLAR